MAFSALVSFLHPTFFILIITSALNAHHAAITNHTNRNRQCKPWMQSPFYIRSLASSGATHQEAGKAGMLKKITASLGHAAAPIGVLTAICSVALLIGVHTATQHFVRSPSVHVTKRNRGSMPEVDQPDVSIRSGDNLINKSFLRKVGHLQDKQYGDETVANIYTRSRESDTLQTVGVIDKK